MNLADFTTSSLLTTLNLTLGKVRVISAQQGYGKTLAWLKPRAEALNKKIRVKAWYVRGDVIDRLSFCGIVS